MTTTKQTISKRIEIDIDVWLRYCKHKERHTIWTSVNQLLKEYVELLDKEPPSDVIKEAALNHHKDKQ